MESELKKIQDIAIKAYNGVMKDREADEAIREILAKYGIPKEKSKNVTAEQLYSTRLVHAKRDTKDGKTQKNVKTSAESFLVEEWSKAYLCASQDEPIGRLKKKLGMTKPTLYELVAGAFLLVLQNASADWVKVYVAPLKEEITGKEEHKFGYATSHWDGELVKKISREELKASWEKMSEQSADAPLRQAVKEYNEPMLRELLSAKDQVNEYLKASQNFVSKGIKNDYGTTEEDKKIAGTINSNPTPNTDAIRVVSEFFENWEYGLGWLDAPNKRSEKLPYRVIRHLFFLILGLNDPLYGSADDLRALLIQLGFALEMPSAKIDTLLKDSGLAGIDYKANEIILAYTADHFKENAYLHARALQKIYELQNRTTTKNKTDTVVLKQTVFYQYSYTESEWSKLEPSAFLAQCQKDNIAWRRVQDLINPPKQRKKTSLKAEDANAELQESSKQMTNIVIYSSQLFEIRKILIDLYLMIKIDEEENLKKKEEWKKLYDEINRAYENKLLSLNHSTNFSDESAGWKKFLQWNKNISHPIPIKIEEKYPFGVDEMGQKDDPERGNESLIYRRIKDAENCVKMAKYLLRDDFLRLAFWDYLITEPSKNLRGKKPMEIMQSFANREKPVLERCRLKPYNPDKDALTQDFIRAVENRKKEAI